MAVSFFIHNQFLIKMLSNIVRWKQILKGKKVMFQYFLLSNLVIPKVPFCQLLLCIITIVRSIMLTLRILDNIRHCCCSTSTKELSDATERWYWNKDVVSTSLCRADSWPKHKFESDGYQLTNFFYCWWMATYCLPQLAKILGWELAIQRYLFHKG